MQTVELGVDAVITPAAVGMSALNAIALGAAHAASRPSSIAPAVAAADSHAPSAQTYPSAKSLFSPQLLSALFDQLQASDVEASGDSAEAGESDETLALSDEDVEALVSVLEANGAEDSEPFTVDFEGSTYVFSLESEEEPDQAQ